MTEPSKQETTGSTVGGFREERPSHTVVPADPNWQGKAKKKETGENTLSLSAQLGESQHGR